MPYSEVYTRIHSNPTLSIDDPSVVPDVEVFEIQHYPPFTNKVYDREGIPEEGFYCWFCLPGEKPTSPSYGPFPTKEAAVKFVQIIRPIILDYLKRL